MNAAVSQRKHTGSLSTVQPRVPLGQQLLAAGKLTETQIALILKEQPGRSLRFGQTAVELGLLSEKDLQNALAVQFRYPCVVCTEPGLGPSLFAANEPFGRRSEAMRSLRSQLQFRWFDDRRKSIAITSAGRGEVGAEVAANLAVSFAQLSERVLLIDANLRGPRQHTLFGLDAPVGLSSLLNDRCDVQSVLTHVPSFDNLTVLCAGAVPPNPQELLNRVAFSYLVETAPRLFDIVIIDTPPILDFADAQLTASLVGGCVLTTHRHRTRLADVEEITRQLNGSCVEVVGAVVLD